MLLTTSAGRRCWELSVSMFWSFTHLSTRPTLYLHLSSGAKTLSSLQSGSSSEIPWGHSFSASVSIVCARYWSQSFLCSTLMMVLWGGSRDDIMHDLEVVEQEGAEVVCDRTRGNQKSFVLVPTLQIPFCHPSQEPRLWILQMPPCWGGKLVMFPPSRSSSELRLIC